MLLVWDGNSVGATTQNEGHDDICRDVPLQVSLSPKLIQKEKKTEIFQGKTSRIKSNHNSNHNNEERTYPKYQSGPKLGVNSVKTTNTIQESNTSEK